MPNAGNKEELAQITCAICLTNLASNPDTTKSEATEAIKTPCKHDFHLSCLSEWFRHQDICPICRTKLPPIEDQSDDLL